MPPTTASVRIASFDSRVRNTCHYKKGRDVSVSTPVSEYQCFKYKDSKPVVYLLATLSLRTLKWREGNLFEWEGISSLCKRCINIFIRNSCIHLYLHQKYIHAFQTKIQSKPFQCISCEDILSHSFFFLLLSQWMLLKWREIYTAFTQEHWLCIRKRGRKRKM